MPLKFTLNTLQVIFLEKMQYQNEQIYFQYDNYRDDKQNGKKDNGGDDADDDDDYNDHSP